jgi:4-hydroxy-tetrahydrodipicolinate synthase
MISKSGASCPSTPFRGAFIIPVTPFDPGGDLDEASLAREVDWCVRAGAHGIVTPVMASEVPALTDDERGRITRIACEVVAGRVPVIIGASGAAPQASFQYARAASAAGADAVIATPPYGVRAADAEFVLAFYRTLADAAGGLPVFIQNWAGPGGSPQTVSQLVRLLRQIPGVSYVKEEAQNPGHAMTAIRDTAGDACRGVFGGMCGRYLLNEFRRGSSGTMPACQTPDVHAAVWNALDSGDFVEARRLFNRLLPLLNLEAQWSTSLCKEVLLRRGVIAHAGVRGRSVSPLDALDRQELDAVLEDLSELWTV